MAWLKKFLGFVGAVMMVAGCSKTEQPEDFEDNPPESSDAADNDDILPSSHDGAYKYAYGPASKFCVELPKNDSEPIQDDIDAPKDTAPPSPLPLSNGMPIICPPNPPKADPPKRW